MQRSKYQKLSLRSSNAPQGGKSVANILFGKCSPSGKLPVTFYNSAADLPDFCDYSMQNRTYRYFKGEVQYPFG
ncbi:MAG: glycoside hydrolase family 3 C-terminal domain-containing protein [Oscillospiraceae bacterium]|nr:glycoside hydrolase family 3 C-terminal domain-containing protein [Oscillospiraceae bacterium]